ncbi:DHA2 family efflux MFS transporter permease subunit [Clostridium sp. PL3]|uniref:DHA2 family efflux MFS transporter permease subunit n=1 Tax=Clostridium thailandense TaxID=2794346 RepID=A0A949U357_9CLOT|nr:DHA2 family efflux MFS transporter permease subunit [Clostridium thailandense]MBV7275593.1 DHA2 family efflux MFS transporter permease subunit [Clostridium thailandense]
MDKEKGNSYKWITMSVVVLGLFMVNLATSIVNLSTSKMMQTFGSSLDQIQWVVSAYTLTMGVTIPSTGYLSERFGFKKIFVIALSMFTLGSLMCGISWNLISIITARIIQGVGGAFIISLGMTILMTTFDREEMPMVISTIGICNMAAPALGPTLGGYIVENVSWRFAFFINIPIGIISIITAIIVLRKSDSKLTKYFDIIGFLSSAIGMALILYVLGKSNLDWSDIKNVLLMIVGCYSMLIFVVNELLIPEPMLNLRLLKNYTFCMSNIIMNVALLALNGAVFLMPVFLQQIKGLTAMQAGWILFPEAIATGVSMSLYGKLGNKIDTRIFAITALILIGLNSYSMSKITLETSNDTITFLLAIRGFGVGFLMAPVQTLGLSGLPKKVMSNASALMNTVKQVGTSIGITMITSIMQNRTTANYSDLAQQVSNLNPGSMNLFKMLQGSMVQVGMSSSDAQAGALSQLYGIVVKLSQLQGLNDTMLVISIITAMVIIPTLLLKKSKQLEDDKMNVATE